MAAWLVVAAVVGVLIGRVIRGRERQVPGDLPAGPGVRIPAQGSGLPRSAPRSSPPAESDSPPVS